jgi:cytidylate kinase
MAVITISRQVGSGGTEVATHLCEQLGYAFFNKQLMAEVAVDVGLSACEVVDFTEEDYRARGFFERLFKLGSRYSVGSEPIRGDSGQVALLTIAQLDEPRCVEFVRSTLMAAYHRGNVVIVGRGGQAILRDMPDVLHVRLEAPEGTRIRRIMEQENCSFSQAYQLMVDRDRAAQQYLSQYFGIRWDDPMLYHLIINTGKLEPKQAARVIATALKAIEEVPAEASAGTGHSG